MADLVDVIRALADAAAHSPGWTAASADVVAEWLEDNEQPVLKPATKATGGKTP